MRRRLPAPGKVEHTSPGTCDVLSVQAYHPQWLAYRGERVAAAAAASGVRWGWHSARDLRLDRVVEVIESANPRAVVNEAWCLSVDEWRELPRRFPDVHFISLNHSHPSATASHPVLAASDERFQQIAAEFPNASYGHVVPPSEWPFPPNCRTFFLPNVVAPCAPAIVGNPEREKDGVLAVSLIARADPVKNWIPQAAAIALAARQLPVRAILSTALRKDPIYVASKRLLDRAGVPVVELPWSGWETFLRHVHSYVDVGMCCTLTESFGLASLEHCLLGKPIVASPSLSWALDEWMARPDSPGAMAGIILRHAADLAKAAASARRLGQATAALTNEAFRQALPRLLRP